METNSKQTEIENMTPFERVNHELGKLLEKFDELVSDQEFIQPEEYNNAFLNLLQELKELNHQKKFEG